MGDNWLDIHTVHLKQLVLNANKSWGEFNKVENQAWKYLHMI